MEQSSFRTPASFLWTKLEDDLSSDSIFPCCLEILAPQHEMVTFLHITFLPPMSKSCHSWSNDVFLQPSALCWANLLLRCCWSLIIVLQYMRELRHPQHCRHHTQNPVSLNLRRLYQSNKRLKLYCFKELLESSCLLYIAIMRLDIHNFSCMKQFFGFIVLDKVMDHEYLNICNQNI